MIFSRTKSGLKNTHRFHGVEIIVYIEGQNDDSKFDKNFYEKIFLECSNYGSVKIKPIGNCLQVIEMYEKICLDDKNKSICFLDRDYLGLKYSYINDNRLKFTYGYSWENDFWSDQLIIDTADSLTGGKIKNLNFNLYTLISNTKLHAYKLSCLDCISQIHDISLLNKRTGTFGLKISRDCQVNTLISRNEQLRIKKKSPIIEIKKCSISKDIYKRLLKEEKCRVIQGHFWEILSINIIKSCLNVLCMDYSIPYEYIKNVARSLFLNNFDKYIESNIKKYYCYQLVG